MLTKNLPKKTLVRTLFIRLVLDGIAGIRFLTQGKPKHVWSVLHAHFSFYNRIFKFSNKRDTQQSENYYKINSIVYRYYVSNDNLFEKLK